MKERFARLKSKTPNAAMQEILTGKKSELKEIEIEKLIENPYQPRIQIKKDEVKELADSIREQGLIQPIVVTKINNTDRYYIVAGHRRVEAHKTLNKKRIKAYVMEDVKDDVLASVAMVENLQRSDLNLIESAMAIKRYKERFNKNLDEIAKELGKDKTFISRMINILKLPEEIIKDIRENKSTQDVIALSLLNTYINKKLNMFNFSKKSVKSVDLEGGNSQKWENDVKKETVELYKEFLKRGRSWLKHEVEKRLKSQITRPKVEIKVTKKHGITIKINSNLNLSGEKIREFEEELQRLVEKFKEK